MNKLLIEASERYKNTLIRLRVFNEIFSFIPVPKGYILCDELKKITDLWRNYGFSSTNKTYNLLL